MSSGWPGSLLLSLLARCNELVEKGRSAARIAEDVEEDAPALAGKHIVRRMRVVLLGLMQIGKSTLLEHLCCSWLCSQAEYSAMHPEGNTARKLQDMEAYHALKQSLSEEPASGADEGAEPVITQMPIAKYYFNKEDRPMQERVDWMERKLEGIKKYRLDGDANTGVADILSPRAGKGRAGTPVGTAFSYSAVPQVLSTFYPLSHVSNLLRQHLRVKTMSRKAQKHVDITDRNYYQEAWRMFIRAGTDIEVELAAYKQDPTHYEPPIKTWLPKLLGSSGSPSFVFYTRIPTDKDNKYAPSLHAELLYVSDIIRLHLKSDTFHSDEHLQQLLRHLAAQDLSGPWEELLAADDAELQLKELQALTMCLKHLHVFLPNKMLQVLGVELVDSLGVDDNNSTRRIRQRQLEASADNVIVMVTESSLTQPTIDHLVASPFLQKWVQGQVDPGAPSKPTLSILVYREVRGWPRPPRDAEAGNTITLPYLQQHGDHLRRVIQTEATSPIKEDDLTKLLDAYCEAAEMQPEDADRLVPLLAQAVQVYACLPMLGTNILQKGLVDGAEALPADMASALDITNLDRFTALLLLPVLENARSIAGANAASMWEQRDQLLQLADTMTSLREDKAVMLCLKSNKVFGHRHTAQVIKVIEHNVGSGSNLYTQFHNRFGDIRKSVLSPAILAFCRNIKPLFVNPALKRVMDHIQTTYLVPNAPYNVDTLAHVLQPNFKWLKDDLPLDAWLYNTTMAAVSFEGIRSFLNGDVLNAVQRTSDQLLQDLAMDMLSDAHYVADKELVRHIIADFLNLKAEVDNVFRRAFFPGQKARLLQQYSKLLRVTWATACAKVSRGETCYDTLHNAILENDYGIDNSAVETAVRAVLQRHLELWGDTFAKQLEQRLVNQFRDLRDLLYERHVATIEMLRKANRNNSVLIGNYKLLTKQFWSIGTAEGERSVRRLHKAAAEVQGVAGELMSLAEPEQLLHFLEGEGHDRALLHMLSGGLKSGLQLLALQNASLLSTRALKQTLQLRQSAAKLTPGGPQGGTEAVLNANAAPAQPLPSNWYNDGGSVTHQQMYTLVRHLQDNSLQLLDAPGVGNNCVLYAILHQVYGIALDAADPHARAVVEHWRQLLHTSLSERLRAEQEMPEDMQEWTLACCAEAGAQPGTAAGAAAVTAHLAGLADDAPLTDVDLAALEQLLPVGVALTVYNPTYAASEGFSYSYGAQAAGTCHVRIANVWYGWVLGEPVSARRAGASGELNHWMVVAQQHQVAAMQEAAQAAAGEQQAGPGAGAAVKLEQQLASPLKRAWSGQGSSGPGSPDGGASKKARQPGSEGQ